jgi:membrane fusion protein (multidrug efflux system)
VRALLPNPDGRLRAGMLLRVAVRLPERQALGFPEIALQQEGSQASVFRVGAGDKVALVPVELGSRKEGKVEVTSGLKAGDRVVVEGIVKLHDGSSIVEATPGAAADATPAAAE